MAVSMRIFLSMLTVAAVSVGTSVLAATPAGALAKSGEFNDQHKSVEMFQAIEQGQIDVKVIPKDSSECNVLIENKTDQPLNVQLPAAFGGVPVLAQFGGGAGGMGGGLGGGGGSSTQSFGGGMGGMGGGGMMGGGGGFFNVAPEKVGQFKVPTVCLEHGKKEPRAAIPYEIRPIEQVTDKPAVHALCAMLGTGQVNQRAAQVAAWNLNCNMSWQELAAKRLRFANGTSRPYFLPTELRAGVQLAAMAVQKAEQKPAVSPGEQQAASAN